MRARNSSIIGGAVVGVMAGIAASFAMNKFQEATSGLQPESSGNQDDPSTVKAATRAVGHDIPQDEKPNAGNEVHYAFGAFLGALYGAAAAVAPSVTSGFGLPYGFAVALVADEGVVPSLRLSGPPWETPPSTHVFSVASHLVFGAVLELTRRVLRSV